MCCLLGSLLLWLLSTLYLMLRTLAFFILHHYTDFTEFDRIARKYGVDYAIKRDRSSDPPKFLVFFKSRDADALTSAFNEYVGKKVKKASRPSVLQRLAHFKELVKNTVVNREKRRELER